MNNPSYFSFLPEELISIIAEYIFEFDDSLPIINLQKSKIGFINSISESQYRGIYNNLLNRYLNKLSESDHVKNFIKSIFENNKISWGGLSCYRQLKFCVKDAGTLLSQININDDFIFDIQLINIDIGVLNNSYFGIDFNKIKIVYNLYLDNRYKFLNKDTVDEGPPQLLVRYENGKIVCELYNHGFDYGDPISDSHRKTFIFYISEDQLKCLVIALLFHNYNVSTIGKSAYDIIGKVNKEI